MEKNLEGIQPINHGIIANPHTPIYKIHRYFARRPYNVFNYLIEHYSTPESIILDPFCGGGVVIVESLRLKRKVIGVDLNPIATFISKAEAIDVNLETLKEKFDKIKEEISNEINGFYLTNCPKCGKSTPAKWVKWSCVVKCPQCQNEVIIAKSQKESPGKFRCNNCNELFQAIRAQKLREQIISLKIDCPSCNFKGEKEADSSDIKSYHDFELNIEQILRERKLEYPRERFPDADRQRDDAVFQKGISYFKDFFTKRNFLSLSLLLKEIDKIPYTQPIGFLLRLTFTETLGWTSKMSSDTGHGWQHHAYWLPYVFYENNVWHYFKKRFDVVLKGKKYCKKEIGEYYNVAKDFSELLMDKTCLLLTQSATNLPIPSSSVDAIITDPPYGGNVQYTELSNFYAVWIKNILGIDGLIDAKDEAIQTRHDGFVGAKSHEHYQKMLYEIFKECHRVLKPNRWMVLTFHNRKISVWNTLLIAAHDAGFILPEQNGVIYQPPIGHYTTTLHQRASGSMLGDFILSFKRSDSPPVSQLIDEKDIETKIISQVNKVIEYHAGANISTIYMQLMPFLTNEGLLHKVGQKDLEPYLKKDFVKKGEKWYFKEHLDESGNLKPIQAIPAELRIEELIRSILHEKKRATLDEIYGGLLMNLTNGQTPETNEIMVVLDRVAKKVKLPNAKRDLWELKTQKTLSHFVDIGKGVWEKTSEEQADISHDKVIEFFYYQGRKKGFDVHIGQTEQRKNPDFKEKSIPMGDNVQFGLNLKAFKIILEIDVLWIKNNTIISAYEVEKSTTIDSGINRFRNLFAATPNIKIGTYIVAPDQREREAIKKIESLANIKEGIDKKIVFIPFSKLSSKGED